MSEKHLSTESYKGVRDFYPEDMAIERYIFDTWSKTAETFGFSRYDASILEPAELYKAKGAENEELVNEQTYTFTDRGEREVTLRPEMTPTVARMIAGKRRELQFPVRWYSIPNLFRYERPQRGRLREHWQLNCDIFGGDPVASDIELIALAYQTLLDFGATPDKFEVKVNSRAFMNDWYSLQGIVETSTQQKITKLNDRKHKISADEYKSELRHILAEPFNIDLLVAGLENSDFTELATDTPIRQVMEGLNAIGITNVSFDKTLARGFNYYTGTIFEIFDVSGENNRAMLGGGRYDNLTSMFSDESVSGVGFGMGDVTMRDFLETHNLLSGKVPKTAPTLAIIPAAINENLAALSIAQSFRTRGIKTTLDTSTKKLGKKIGDAASAGTAYVLIVGSDERNTATYTLKNLTTGSSEVGSLESHIAFLLTNS